MDRRGRSYHRIPALEDYISRYYIDPGEELSSDQSTEPHPVEAADMCMMSMAPMAPTVQEKKAPRFGLHRIGAAPEKGAPSREETSDDFLCEAESFYDRHESRLQERMEHLSDTFTEYLLYLIDSRGMTYPDVYKRALIDKKVFSKIKNNPKAHPKKMTAMCLCIGAMLNLDQAKDLLARAGYALSPCDKTDVIFSYFLENEIYDMIELDIQLEAHGLPCLIE